VFENRVMGRVFEPKRDEVTGENFVMRRASQFLLFTRCFCRDLLVFMQTRYHYGDQIKKVEVGRSYSMHGRVEKCTQNFGWKTFKKQSILEA
jgi:hypothetical protein